jgi:hypothetical protein
MNFFHATILGFTAWRVCTSGALLVLFVVLQVHWAREKAKRQREVQVDFRETPNVPQTRKWKRSASVALTDTQRIDHLQRHLSLKAGEHADLKDLTFGRLPKLRIAFAGIENSSDQDYAHIKIELGGAVADCGKSVRELRENNFLVPRAAQGDQHGSIHYTCGEGDAVSFLKVTVSKFDVVKQSASIDVLHVRGRRAA